MHSLVWLTHGPLGVILHDNDLKCHPKKSVLYLLIAAVYRHCKLWSTKPVRFNLGIGTCGSPNARAQSRVQQCFDHYCKGAPAPKWLSEGVPAVDKGKEFGLELEESKGGGK